MRGAGEVKSCEGGVGTLRIPGVGDQRFGAGVGKRGPVRAAGLEQIPRVVDVLQGIILAEVLLDALAQSEKPQDHEDDHDDADDVDDAVHELTLCVGYRIAWRAPRDARSTHAHCTLFRWVMPGPKTSADRLGS